MKLKNVTIAIFLCLTMLISSVSVCAAQTLDNNNVSNQTIQAGQAMGMDSKGGYSNEELKSLEKFNRDFLAKQDKASEIHEKLMNSFGNVEELKANDYSDNYGGNYINDDGNLVIYVKGSINDHKQEFIQRSGSDEIILQPCDNSFKDLTKIMDTLNTFKQKNADSQVCKNFNCYFIDDAHNRVVVELDNYCPESIQAFKEQVLDSPAIKFQKASGKLQDKTNVNAGSWMAASSGYAGTVGYRVKRSGIVGIVTAGHVALMNNTISDSYGNTFGTCTARQYSGSVDASFCKITNSSFTPTNTIDGTSNVLSTTISEPGVGTVVNMAGGASSLQSGKILSTNASWTINGVTFTNLTSTNVYAVDGDSGGLFYSYISSTGTRYTLGILKGGSSTVNYYVKANQINSALGTSRY